MHRGRRHKKYVPSHIRAGGAHNSITLFVRPSDVPRDGALPARASVHRAMVGGGPLLSVFVREHEREHAGRLRGVGGIGGAELEGGIVAVDLEKELVPRKLEAPEIVLAFSLRPHTSEVSRAITDVALMMTITEFSGATVPKDEPLLG